jgi:hypothetical protein
MYNKPAGCSAPACGVPHNNNNNNNNNNNTTLILGWNMVKRSKIFEFFLSALRSGEIEYCMEHNSWVSHQ